MIYVDKYAYFSGLKETNPLLKILFGGASLFACVGSRSLISFAIVFATMFGITIFKGGIPLGYYLKLLALSLGFLLFGVIGVAVDISSSSIPEGCLASLNVGGYDIFVSQNGLRTAGLLVCKSLAAVACMYFIILTTPLRDIVHVMQKMGCPRTIVSLSVLIYQFIFLLLDIADVKLKSLRCRGGFQSLKRFPGDFARLWGSVFVQAWFKSQCAFKSMQARDYDGRLKFMPKQYRLRPVELLLLSLFPVLVILPNFIPWIP